MESNELLEKLADLEHQQWSHWTKFFMSQMPIPKNNLEYKQWRVQMRTEYKDLSEEDKEKDRKWARKVLEVMENGKRI